MNTLLSCCAKDTFCNAMMRAFLWQRRPGASLFILRHGEEEMPSPALRSLDSSNKEDWD
jgi:hypothetical protein